ncbi:LLM class flavin-dependent oxidoreductase [Streptomyces actinomycinicus]|uniref:LLM class flavin-dependent oxidoreductase n=1 Tax=Streptomyces actinomycinicus TaxID=1695166 RepID=A0A937JRL2_9ACTN|nr:MupA/Atu3671 family FMN-dependent luciferase-like monooxygenase [Streptomyces actinomycinicus]MBL1086546.1 LLM class flavin-dependent oxidoreductase [Streptomyces actinomycinicus]
MDFSLFYFGNSPAPEPAGAAHGFGARPYGLLLEGARFADRNGFTAVWTPERHFSPFGGLYPNPAVTGAAVASITSRVGIRAGSVVGPLHDPLRIAEEWAVVDNLSGGRAGIAFASGWHAQDFALRPDAYADRRDVLARTVEQVRHLWRGGTLDRPDGNGTTGPVGVHPRPVRHALPVWITSSGGPDTFTRAGSAGAGVLTHLVGQDLDALERSVTAYRTAYTARPGSDASRGHVVVMLHTFLGTDDAQVRELVREPMSAYLRSSLTLLLGSQTLGVSRPVDPARLSERHVDTMVRRAFDRYYDDGSLLGTLPKAAATVERLRAIGVDEIACFIDFGLPERTVLDGLGPLAELVRASATVPEVSR